MTPREASERKQGGPRAQGAARLAVRSSHAASRIHRLYQQGCAKMRFPARSGTMQEAVLINTAGGVTGGDQLDWRIEVGEHASCTALTQACEKAYRSEGEAARIGVSLVIAAGARLDWLPQETILFEDSKLERRFEADLSGDARLLAVEAVILGRRARGETAHGARLTDQWRVRRNGRLIFADALRLDRALQDDGPALLEGAGAYALVLLADADAESLAERARSTLEQTTSGARAGVSAFDSKLVCRILAPDGAALRRMLLPLMALLRDAPAPRLWMV